MGSKMSKEGGGGLSRRDFLKVTAAGAAATAAFDWAQVGPAFATTGNLVAGNDYATYHTTCPYCSASCGQVVAVATRDSVTADGMTFKSGDVLDIWGDNDSPINQGGLCAKGAGSLQLVNNARRIGVPENTQGVSELDIVASDGTTPVSGFYGEAWKRQGNGPWQETTLASAMDAIGVAFKNARDAVGGTGAPSSSNNYNNKNVQFFGCSHMNNEANNTYRKIIAQFGTTMTEHQARI